MSKIVWVSKKEDWWCKKAVDLHDCTMYELNRPGDDSEEGYTYYHLENQDMWIEHKISYEDSYGSPAEFFAFVDPLVVARSFVTCSNRRPMPRPLLPYSEIASDSKAYKEKLKELREQRLSAIGRPTAVIALNQIALLPTMPEESPSTTKESQQPRKLGRPKGEIARRNSEKRQVKILEIVEKAGRIMIANEILSELKMTAYGCVKSTLKDELSVMVNRKGSLMNLRGRSGGYYLPAWIGPDGELDLSRLPAKKLARRGFQNSKTSA